MAAALTVTCGCLRLLGNFKCHQKRRRTSGNLLRCINTVSGNISASPQVTFLFFERFSCGVWCLQVISFSLWTLTGMLAVSRQLVISLPRLALADLATTQLRGQVFMKRSWTLFIAFICYSRHKPTAVAWMVRHGVRVSEGGGQVQAPEWQGEGSRLSDGAVHGPAPLPVLYREARGSRWATQTVHLWWDLLHWSNHWADVQWDCLSFGWGKLLETVLILFLLSVPTHSNCFGNIGITKVACLSLDTFGQT